MIRPLAFASASGRLPLALVFRYDRDDPDAGSDSYIRYVVGGLLWDLNANVSVALDYQETLPQDGQPAARSNTRQIYFAHFQAKF